MGLLLLMALGAWPLGCRHRARWSLWAVMIRGPSRPSFNPLALDGAKVRQDVKRWLLWMRRKDSTR